MIKKRGVRESVVFVNYVERNELCILGLKDGTNQNLYIFNFSLFLVFYLGFL